MPRFTFEVRYGKGRPAVTVEELPSQKAAWCYVEFLASQLKDKAGARIRVRNERDELVIEAGAATALASIGWCSDLSCPLKPPRKEH